MPCRSTLQLNDILACTFDFVFRTSLLGKVLRVNVDSGRRNRYTIPTDNPFYRRSGRDEIYAYGLRNPWKCSMDKGDHVTGLWK